MILDPVLLESLAVEFLRRRGENYITGTVLPGDAATNLGSNASKFSTLYVRTLHADSVVAPGTSMDMVDGFHASSTPQPNTLLALDANGRFPAAAIGNVLMATGGTLTGNLSVAPGVTVDGVDINVFRAEYDQHRSSSAAQAHAGVGPHDHRTALTGGDLTQYASADGQGYRSAFMAERLHRYAFAGYGLAGGGLLDQNISFWVNAGNGLGFSSVGQLELTTPGTLSASSANNAVGSHTHAVLSTSDATSASLLRSDNNGGLRLRRLAIGTSAIPTDGNLTASGIVRANRIVSDLDTFVGSNLSVGVNLLNTRAADSTVFINRETMAPPVVGALTVRPAGPSQRGVVVQGNAGQLVTAPLLSATDQYGQDVFRVLPDGTLESGKPAFVSGQRGWRITGEGDAEFRNIVARGELHTSVFVANEMHATGGTMAVMSTGVVESPVVTNDNVVGTTFNLIIAGDPNLPGTCPFKLNDVLRLKLITGLQEN